MKARVRLGLPLFSQGDPEVWNLWPIIVQLPIPSCHAEIRILCKSVFGSYPQQFPELGKVGSMFSHKNVNVALAIFVFLVSSIVYILTAGPRSRSGIAANTWLPPGVSAFRTRRARRCSFPLPGSFCWGCRFSRTRGSASTCSPRSAARPRQCSCTLSLSGPCGMWWARPTRCGSGLRCTAQA